MSGRTRMILMGLGAVAMVLPAVVGVDGEGAAAKPPGAFETIDCPPGLVPAPVAGRTECGLLTVPEDRTAPPGRAVVLPVAIVRSTAVSPAPDPIVMLSGGPGEAGLATFLSPRWASVIEQLTATRDVIMLDQRSTGAATPALACPEVDQAILDTLSRADDPLAERSILEDAYRACFERLRADGGVDLDQYDTPATVADLEALRRALDIDDWNIYGLSYGTTVALEALRSTPGHLRSVVLDAALPPFADNLSPAGLVAAGERGFEALFERCDQPPGCPVLDLSQFPPGFVGLVDGAQLEQDLARLQSYWNANPYATIDPVSGQVLHLTGDDAVWALFKGQYYTDILQVLPTFIELLAPGDAFFGVPIPLPLDVFVQQLPAVLSFDRGTWATVNCADKVAVMQPDTLMEVWTSEPVYRSILLDSPTLPELCEATVRVDQNAPAFAKVLPRNVPTLVLAGGNDPITPPAFGAATADLLGRRAEFVLIPGIGHVAVGNSGGCGDQLLVDFVNEPAGTLDTSCAVP